MPILNNLTVNEIGGSSTIYGLNDKAWAGDLQTDQYGHTKMRTDQAVGTLTGLNTVTRIDLGNKFSGSTGLVGAVDLSSVTEGNFANAFSGTSITSLNLKRLIHSSDSDTSCYNVCSGCAYLTTVDLSDLWELAQNYETAGLYGAFSNCSALREIRLPSVRLDSWWWSEQEDPDTGEIIINYLDGLDSSFYGMIEGCNNLVVHLSSSLGEDLENLEGSDVRPEFLATLCANDQTTINSCSLVFDLPPNDRFGIYINHTYRACERQPSSDTATSLAWHQDLGIVYTSGLTAPQVGDTVYSDSSCTVAVTTIVDLIPAYEYVEPEPEEGGDEGGEEEGGEEEGE